MYEQGEGVPASRSKAFEWVLKFAVFGFADAQFKLAGLYEDGSGAMKNEAKATKWLQKAADQGHALTQFRLGDALEKGSLVRRMSSRRSIDFSHLRVMVLRRRNSGLLRRMRKELGFPRILLGL